MKGVQLETLASAELMNGEPISDGAPVPPPLDTPSGIDLVEGLLFVTDNANSHIYVFDLAGNLVDWADTGLKEGSLAGIRAMSSQEIWFVDQKGDAVYRLTM